ncbi:multinuclear nonheme iron-dependent oxidase [Streptomyces bottropensis]|uniref:multinuclear nonheme iron-dependent oxidase n=1 Tax=Streptomyces bottropensis TaxID=42235 RepID=UPI0036CDE284
MPAPFSPVGPTKLGVAYSSYVGSFLADHPGKIDYVEVPFELVHYDRRPLGLPDDMPLLLHCASLSLAGDVPPTAEIVDSVAAWVSKTGVPWLSEHMAFVTSGSSASFDGSAAPSYDVGYSVNPPLNAETAQRVISAVERYRHRFGVPLLLENPPIYFAPPGSTMTPTEFANLVCAGCPARLLVDVAHFYLSCRNLGLDPVSELLGLPLDRIDQLHVSGVSERDSAWWDDHTVRAPNEVHDLLSLVLRSTTIAAITLEYNWSGNFPTSALLEEIERVRGSLAVAGVAA